jgi:pyrroline-5-carboxylate reductase
MKIGFLGCGKLARSILRGISKRDLWKQHSFSASVTQEASAASLRQEFAIEVFTDNQSLVDFCDLIILGAKPHQISSILSKLKPLPRSKTWVSLCAGLSYEKLRSWLPSNDEVVRAMPSTSSAFNESMTLLYADKKHALVNELFQAVGSVLWVSEDLRIDQLAPVTASSPAFIYHLMEGFEDYMTSLELNPTETSLLIGQMLKGVAQKILSESKSAEELIKEVATPGGMTVAGLRKLTEFEARKALTEALKAAYERSKELASR